MMPKKRRKNEEAKKIKLSTKAGKSKQFLESSIPPPQAHRDLMLSLLTCFVED